MILFNLRKRYELRTGKRKKRFATWDEALAAFNAVCGGAEVWDMRPDDGSAPYTIMMKTGPDGEH